MGIQRNSPVGYKETIYVAPGKAEVRLIDIEKSVRLAEELGTYEEYCWYNAIGAMFLENMNAVYVEGMQIWEEDDTTQLWEHGWLEENGIIIDPYPKVDWERDNHCYFPAIRYTKFETNLLTRRKILPPYARHIDSPYHAKYMNVVRNANAAWDSIRGQTDEIQNIERV